MTIQSASFLAAIILYDPPESFLILSRRLQDQGCEVLLIVNKPNSIVKSVCESEKVHLFLEEENLGIATALNKAINSG